MHIGFTSIEIQGLRGIRTCRIDGLAPLTLVVGPNGCGKSTILEAFGVLSARSAANAFLALAQREWLGLSGMEAWLDEATRKARVRGTWTNGGPESKPVAADALLSVAAGLDARLGEAVSRAGGSDDWAQFDLESRGDSSSAAVDEDGRVIVSFASGDRWLPYAAATASVDRAAGAKARLSAAGFSSELRDALTSLKRSPWYDRFLENLIVLKPRVASIESLALGRRDEPHVIERDPHSVYPLAYAGDGFRRAMVVCATLARARGGVATIDEPEAFAHPRLFQALARLLRRSVEDGTQIVAATHSLEFVAAALQAFADAPEKACVVGLRRSDGEVDPLVVTGPDAGRRVLEFGDDLRM